MFSLAFVTGSLLMIVANYGVRNVPERPTSTRSTRSPIIQANRVAHRARIMVAAGVARTARARLHRRDVAPSAWACTCTRRWTAWPTCTRAARSRWTSSTWPASRRRSSSPRSSSSVFSLALAGHAQSWAVPASPWPWPPRVTFVVLTFPLALLETPKSRSGERCGRVTALLKQCFPLFVALFVSQLIDNMPKFVMEGALSATTTSCTSTRCTSRAQPILLTSGLVYKRRACSSAWPTPWADPAKRQDAST